MIQQSGEQKVYFVENDQDKVSHCDFKVNSLTEKMASIDLNQGIHFFMFMS